MRLRAWLAKVLSACGVMRPSPIERALGPLCVSAVLIAIALSSAIRSFSIGSEQNIRWRYRYRDITKLSDEGRPVLEYGKFHDVLPDEV